MNDKLEKLVRGEDNSVDINVGMYGTSRELILDVRKEIESGAKKIRYSNTALRDRDFIHGVFNGTCSFGFEGDYLVMEVRK